jgi:hypothetical protein
MNSISKRTGPSTFQFQPLHTRVGDGVSLGVFSNLRSPANTVNFLTMGYSYA